jgi:hypothetical protein
MRYLLYKVAILDFFTRPNGLLTNASQGHGFSLRSGQSQRLLVHGLKFMALCRVGQKTIWSSVIQPTSPRTREVPEWNVDVGKVLELVT